MGRARALVEVEVYPREMREKSLAVWDGVTLRKGSEEMWVFIPLSQIDIEQTEDWPLSEPLDRNKTIRLVIPEWLAQEKGLI